MMPNEAEIFGVGVYSPEPISFLGQMIYEFDEFQELRIRSGVIENNLLCPHIVYCGKYRKNCERNIDLCHNNKQNNEEVMN